MQDDSTKENSSEASRAEIISEIEDDLVIRQQRRRMFPRAALVGFFAGLVAALFPATLALADNLRNELNAWSQHDPLWGWIFPVAFSMVGVIVSVLLVQRFA